MQGKTTQRISETYRIYEDINFP